MMVTVFIATAIMLSIGVAILGSTDVVDCAKLTGGSTDPKTGWGLECENIQKQTQDSYSLLVVILIVVAAIAILSVVRLLG